MADSNLQSLLSHPTRNPGVPLDLEWVASVHANRSAIERRAALVASKRSVKKANQAAWLLRAISCIDLTTLGGDDTPANVKRLCLKAKKPIKEEVVSALKIQDLKLHTGAVCVYHQMVPTAVKCLEGSGIPVAAVAAGFPHGLSPMRTRIEEIKASVEAGASEIDIVITRAHVLNGEWSALYDEVAAFREACGDAHLKSILATGELGSLQNVGRASLVAMMAGSDFIKTSTGKETENAVLPVGLVMTGAIKEFLNITGYSVGYKPAGGIRTAKQSLDWLILMNEQLGKRWLDSSLFRIGASGLLTDIERQLELFATGRYANARFQPAP